MKIRINMPKAREIHRANIRTARAPKLAELDTTFQRELEKPKPNTAAIIAKKQQLRDLPAAPAIEAATTPEALKATWPADLLGPSPYARPNETRVRARDEQGRFIGDDPATPDVNEAWIQAPS